MCVCVCETGTDFFPSQGNLEEASFHSLTSLFVLVQFLILSISKLLSICDLILVPLLTASFHLCRSVGIFQRGQQRDADDRVVLSKLSACRLPARHATMHLKPHKQSDMSVFSKLSVPSFA